MKTLIFESYLDFLNREDKTLNGVSKEHAAKHSDYEEDNDTNTGCWNCSRCLDCSRCSYCSRCSDCSGCLGCSDCSGCSGCLGCLDCSRCSDCLDCSRCLGCLDCVSIDETDAYICITNIYRYTCCPRIKENGEQWVQMGCYLRKREDWERDFWNNNKEFPNNGSEKSNKRLEAFKFACLWLDSQVKSKSKSLIKLATSGGE